jgi:hypothetical protein
MGSANRTAMRELEVNMPASSVHPAYDSTSRANDIAVIRLMTPIVPTANINPIGLPPNGVNLPSENEEGLFAGFGFQSISGNGPSQFIHRGFQRTTGNTRCASFFTINSETGFCAEDLVERSSACQGDVGNPFVLSYRRQDMLVGILSMHPACGHLSPTAYTRVSSFRVWITEQLAI